MKQKMTIEQKEIFYQAAKLGIACGMFHPCEWYVNYKRSFINFLPYEQLTENEIKLNDTFKLLFSDNEEKPLTDHELWILVDKFYSGMVL